MKVIAPRALYNATLARDLTAGEEVDVDDDLGAQLVAQGWRQSARKSRNEKAPTAGDEDAPPAPNEEQ